jgi:hypothetical protein
MNYKFVHLSESQIKKKEKTMPLPPLATVTGRGPAAHRVEESG